MTTHVLPDPILRPLAAAFGDVAGLASVRSYPPELDDEVLDSVVGLADPSLGSYTRFELRRDAGAMVVLIVWFPGQWSPPHDHGGSSCVFRVQRGVAHERRFTLDADGYALAVDEDRYLPGAIVACLGDDIHAMGNSADCVDPLVTLHVYRPCPVMREHPVRSPEAVS